MAEQNMNETYVCAELASRSDAWGEYACAKWVINQSPDAFVLSQADAHFIGEWLISFFVLCCVYMMIVKAIKTS